MTIVVPTWNGRHLLQACLPALSRQGRIEVIAIDNGSIDGTCEWLSNEWPSVRTIRNESNLGFARAVNQGLDTGTCRWAALLNNDAIPGGGWLLGLSAVALDAPSWVGAVSSRVMMHHAPRILNSAGIRMDLSGAAWDLWLGETTWPSHPVEVFGASGGACLLRREMLDDIGLFDEGYFAYLEDVDLAWRAQLRGWKTVFAPDAVVYHAMSATAGEGSPFKRYRLAKNKWRVIIRCYPSPQLLQNLPIILAYDNLSIAYSLLHGDTVPLHGRLDAFKELPALLLQRKAIQSRRTASWSDIERVLSPLESPLALRRRARLVAQLASKPAASSLHDA